MRNAGVLCLLCLLVCCVSSAAFGQLYQWTYVTPEEAIQAVRNFESDLGLDVAVVYGPADEAWYGLYRYQMKAGRYTYSFSDGRMDRIDDLYWRGGQDQYFGGEGDPEVLRGRMLPESETEGIAVAFMNAHFPQPSLLNATPVMSFSARCGVFDPGRTYAFRQELPNQVKGPSECIVEVDTVFGNVVLYGSVCFPILISTQPTLTPEQAAAAAVGAMGMADATLDEVVSLSVNWPDAWGLERLVYQLHISGIAPYDATGWADFAMLPAGMDPLDFLDPVVGEKDTCTYIIPTDAHDGSVLNWLVLSGSADKGPGTPLKGPVREHYRYLGMKVDGRQLRLSSPPILIGGHAFIGARYLCQGDMKARLAGKDKTTFLLTREGREFVFTLDSSQYTADGKKGKLPARPQVVNGRLFVPVEAIEGALGWDVTYEPKSMTVSVSTGKPK